MDSNELFDFIGDDFNDEINALLIDTTEIANLKVELIISKIQQLLTLHSVTLGEQAKIDFKAEIDFLKKQNFNAQDPALLIKKAINFLIAGQLNNKKRQLDALKKRKINFRLVAIAGLVIIFISLIALIWYKKNKDIESVVNSNEILVGMPNTKIEITKPIITPKFKSDSIIRNESITLAEIKKDTCNNTQMSMPILKRNQLSFKEQFPVENFTIINNNTTAIRLSSINITIISFDDVLASIKTRELLPEAKYSIELNSKLEKQVFPLKYPIQIDAEDAANIEILFFSKNDNEFVEPFNIGKFIFQISFGTDSGKYKTNNLKISY